MATSFVYVVGPTSNPVKIGYAEDVANRICQLQIGNADELILFKAVPVPWSLASTIELGVHSRLAAYRRRGEWFNVEAEQAIAAVREVASQAEDEHRESLARVDSNMDIWRSLRKRFVIHDAAQEAIDFYNSERKVFRGARAVKTMNGYIVQKAGPAALALFQKVLIEDELLTKHVGGDRLARERGYSLLAAAINALAEYFAYRKRVQLEQSWGSPKVAGNLAELRALDAALTSQALRDETRQRKLASQTAAIAKPKPAA